MKAFLTELRGLLSATDPDVLFGRAAPAPPPAVLAPSLALRTVEALAPRVTALFAAGQEAKALSDDLGKLATGVAESRDPQAQAVATELRLLAIRLSLVASATEAIQRGDPAEKDFRESGYRHLRGIGPTVP